MNQTVLLGKTLEKLYQAALDSAQWRDALIAVEQFTGCTGADDVARFELIRPHLAQALGIADTLGTLSTNHRFSNALLDALPQAVFGLADDGALLFTNEGGERLLGRGICLGVNGRRLVTIDQRQQAEFDRLLTSVTGDDPRAKGGRLLIRSLDGGQPYAARISRIVIKDADILMRPSALLVVDEPGAVTDIDAASLHELYGLTPCETRVAAALLHGHSLQSAAHCQGSSIETVRCHLKSVFRKVGVSRQQDLIRILSDLERSTMSQPIAEAPAS